MTENRIDQNDTGQQPVENSGHDESIPYQQILAEIDSQQIRKKRWAKNISVFLISLLIFFQLGLFSQGWESVLYLVLVLLIHEAGHLLGMRLFGYRNMQMLFIPFFGAAVSGESRNVPTYKKAVVSLLGPLPGIIIGCVLLLMFAATGFQSYWSLAIMFLFINIFNLLPFYPLDGGRFLYFIIFSRHRYLELLFRIFAALALIVAGIYLNSWLLALLGVFNLGTVQFSFKLAKISNEVKQAEQPMHPLDTLTVPKDDPEIIPPDKGKIIIDKIFQYFPSQLNLTTVADYTKQIWERIAIRPAGIFSTAGLLVLYLMAFCLPFASFVGAMVVSVSERRGFVDSRVVEYQKEDGSKRLKEQIYLGTELYSEIEVDPNTFLYDGKDLIYGDANTIFCESTWSQGMIDGPANVYDINGVLIRVTVYDKGNFVSRRVNTNGQWQDKNWDDLSFYTKWYIKRRLKKPQGPAPEWRQ